MFGSQLILENIYNYGVQASETALFKSVWVYRHLIAILDYLQIPNVHKMQECPLFHL